MDHFPRKLSSIKKHNSKKAESQCYPFILKCKFQDSAALVQEKHSSHGSWYISMTSNMLSEILINPTGCMTVVEEL